LVLLLKIINYGEKRSAMKRFIFVLMTMAVMLSGCAEGAPGALNASEPPTNRGQQALLTDNAYEDYGITGEIEVYDPETYMQTKYSGEVSDEAARELWELLRVIEGPSITLEGEQTVDGGCISGRLIFTNKNTGESSIVSDGILYEAPGLCGGPPVIIIGGRYYGDGYLDEYGVTASEKIEELLIKGVAREENVVERKDCRPADTWADKPKRLTDMNFEELEFSGAANVYDRETRVSTEYRGDITGEACRELWELLGELEECEPVELGENGSVGGGCFDGHLMIVNAVTGDEYFITDGIYYSDPMLNGGPTAVVVRGRFRDGSNMKYYFPTYDENGVSLFDKLTDVLCVAIACEENVYCRVQTYPAEPVIVEKKDIAMILSYRNWAWGYQHYGEFVDLSGNVYGFNFFEESVGSDEEFIKLLEDGHFNGRFGVPTLTIGNIDALWEIVDLADHVAEDAKIAEKHEAYDAGQTTLYAVTSEHTLVEICSEGDFRRINTDENALRISAICQKNNIF